MRNEVAFWIILLSLISGSCQSQDSKSTQRVGGPCEGCEAIFEYGGKNLTSSDTLPGFIENQPKLKITGTVFQKDGKSPASDVILYVYHTNKEGIYPTRGNEEGWAKRHGYIRGWVKTGRDGKYTFHTFRPGAYPNGRAAEHIHLTVKEPGKNEYYLDSFLFEDDPLLTDRERNSQRKRGGSGIFRPEKVDGILTIRRDLILGLNIPNYN